MIFLHKLKSPVFAVAIILMVGISFSCAVFSITQAKQKALIELEFDARARRSALLVQRIFQEFARSIFSIHYFFRGSQVVEPDEFKNFVSPLLEDGVADAFIASGVVGVSDDNQMREIKYVESLYGNKVFASFDLLSNVAVSEAFEKAKKTNGFSATNLIALPVSDSGRKSIVLIGPLSLMDMHTKVGEGVQLSGYIAGVFTPDVHLATLKTFPYVGVYTVELFSIQDGHRALIYSTDYSRNKYKTTLVSTTPFRIGSNEYEIVTTAYSMSLHSLYESVPWICLAVGFVFTVLISMLLWLSMTSNERAMLLAERRTCELKASESSLSITLDSIGDAVIATDALGRITRMNHVAEVLTGWVFTDAKDRLLTEVVDITRVVEDGQSIIHEHPYKLDDVLLTLKSASGSDGQSYLQRKDGSTATISHNIAPIYDDNIVHGAVIVFRDITEQIALQEQIFQLRKLESVGQLAGGIAHNFNNILCGISGAVDVIELEIKSINNAIVNRCIKIIQEASLSGGSLTGQLLAFSRKNKQQIVPVNIGKLIEATLEIITHSFDKSISISFTKPKTELFSFGDPVQLQSIFLNLAINARDAMPDGGDISIALSEVMLTEKEMHDRGLTFAAGLYVVISFRDTGVGIPDDVLAHIFEPFFTTKDIGKGTGLGLSVAYGVIKNYSGAICVSSTVGKGSEFTIYLPKTEEFVLTDDIGRGDVLANAKGCILVVDDEYPVRYALGKGLQKAGYKVEDAQDGYCAIEILRRDPNSVDVVILDLSMPGITGKQTFVELRKIRPNIPVILVTGNNVNIEKSEDMLGAPFCYFLPKPFRIVALNEQITRALDDSKLEQIRRAN